MTKDIYLIAYVTTDGETKSTTVSSNRTFGVITPDAIKRMTELVNKKTGDNVKFILSFILLGNLQESEINQLPY